MTDQHFNDSEAQLDRAIAAINSTPIPAPPDIQVVKHELKKGLPMKFALAALIALVLAGVVFWSVDHHSAVAFGDVLKQVQQVNAVRFKVTAVVHPPNFPAITEH